jgi:hypothetical protein
MPAALMSLTAALSDDMIDHPLSSTVRSAKLMPRHTLARSLACLGFVLAAAQLAHASQSIITVNGTGTSLQSPGSQKLSSAQSALTMGSMDILTLNASQLQIAALETARKDWTAAPVEMSYPAEAASLVSWDGHFLATGSIARNEAVLFDDVTPAPEPSTWVAALLAVAVAAFSQRHRFGTSSRTLETT